MTKNRQKMVKMKNFKKFNYLHIRILLLLFSDIFTVMYRLWVRLQNDKLFWTNNLSF